MLQRLDVIDIFLILIYALYRKKCARAGRGTDQGAQRAFFGAFWASNLTYVYIHFSKNKSIPKQRTHFT
jgi:hypothetical protein